MNERTVDKKMLGYQKFNRRECARVNLSVDSQTTYEIIDPQLFRIIKLSVNML